MDIMPAEQRDHILAERLDATSHEEERMSHLAALSSKCMRPSEYTLGRHASSASLSSRSVYMSQGN